MRSPGQQHDQSRKREVWLTFYPQDRADSLADGLGTLEFLDEDRIPPGASIPVRPYDDAEIVTYVHEGAITYEDSKGRSA